MAATREGISNIRSNVYELERLVNKLYFDTVGDKEANPEFVEHAMKQAVRVQELLGNLYGAEVTR